MKLWKNKNFKSSFYSCLDRVGSQVSVSIAMMITSIEESDQRKGKINIVQRTHIDEMKTLKHIFGCFGFRVYFSLSVRRLKLISCVLLIHCLVWKVNLNEFSSSKFTFAHSGCVRDFISELRLHHDGQRRCFWLECDDLDAFYASRAEKISSESRRIILQSAMSLNTW